MKLRSLLFVPGDRPERIKKASAAGADALVLDLEDSVSLEKKAEARALTAEFLGHTERPCALFVRINPLESGLAEEDLRSVIAARPDVIMLPKAEGARSLIKLAERLDDLERRCSLRLGTTRILPIATETPAAMFRLGEYGGVTPRLMGLTWGAEDLPAAIGAASAREEDGSYTAPYQLARSLTLFAAAAADVAPIETVYPAFNDMEGLAHYAARGARDGFTGMMAIHPSQVAIINSAFTISETEVAHARVVIAAFEANPGAGALSLDGKMIDAPHLKHALRVLRRAGLA